MVTLSATFLKAGLVWTEDAYVGACVPGAAHCLGGGRAMQFEGIPRFP